MIVQTNWAVESKKSRSAIPFYKQDENVDNFIAHIEELRPKVILFMGSELLTKVLKFYKVRDKFTPIMGNEIEKLQTLRMPDYHGSLAYINKFENCTVVGLPHPSSGRGITNEYIEFCGSELNPIISQFKKDRGIA